MADIEEEIQREPIISKVEEPLAPEYSQGYSEFETIDKMVNSIITEFGLIFDQPEATTNNMAAAQMLLNILIQSQLKISMPTY